MPDEKILVEIGSEEEKKPTHIDDFIHYGLNDSPEERYARWVFDYFRLPAITKWAFEEFMGDKLLFCQYEGEEWRVTGASRLGDVWLTKNFNQSTGYEKRVSVDKCSRWTKEPSK